MRINTNPPNAAHSWEQTQGETSRAYEAFKCFRDLDQKPRTIINAYREFSGKKQVDKIAAHFFDWKQRFNWDSRVLDYDRHLEAIRMRADELTIADERRKWQKRKIQTRDETWTLADALLKKGKEILDLPMYETVSERVERDENDLSIKHITILRPARGSLTTAVNALVHADKLRRLACDMATERVVSESPDAEYRRIIESAREDFIHSKIMFPDEADAFRAETIANAYGIKPKDIYELYEPLTVPDQGLVN